MKTILTAALILLTSSLCAQQTPVEQHYIDFSGGLNNYKSSVYLEKNESPDLLNVVIDEPLGSISQRNGWARCGSIPSGNTITNMYEYAKNNGTRNMIVSDNISIWQTADCSNFTLISTGHDALAVPRFATVNDNLWIVNGFDYPYVWDGATGWALNGAGTLPTAPKAKLIAWWKSRVWLGNIATDPSALYFSALSDPLGAPGNVLDPAISSTAWANVNNLIYFNRSDGSQLYGLKVYRDNLYGFKDTGISRLVFQSEYQLNVVKNVTEIGSKFQESIVEMDDGLLRYIGRDGEYRFDGSTPQRVSTKWTSTFESFQQPSSAVLNYRAWNTLADWNSGVGVAISTLSAAAQISLYQAATVGPNLGAESGDNSNLTNVGFDNVSTEHYWGARSWKTNILDTSNFYPGFTVAIYSQSGALLSTDNNPPGTTLGVWKEYTVGSILPAGGTGPTVKVVISYSVNYGADHGTLTYPSVVPGITDAYGNKYIYLRYASMYKGAAGSNYSYFDIDESSLGSPITGTFTSGPIHAAQLTNWRSFDVTETLNSGTIGLQVRTAATQAGLQSASYVSINPGDTPAGTNPWLQWTSNWSTMNRITPPIMAGAVANWLTGFPTKSLLSGINYKSRYWVAASTTVGGLYNDVVMVESKPPVESHTMYDLGLSAMTLWNNLLYGAISGTPYIARMDYGSTDGGAAIHSHWTSRDELYDNPLAYKSVNKMIVDYPSTPANNSLQIGLSPDFGATWQYTPVDTGLLLLLARTTRNINPAANRALQFRSRVDNSVLGSGWTIYGMHNYGSASNFLGN